MVTANFSDLIGVPFAKYGRSKNGLDCWGLVKEVFSRYSIELPEYLENCATDTDINKLIDYNRKNWRRVDDKPVPCLITFRNGDLCNHVGVYIGHGMFIHARENIGVAIERIGGSIACQKVEGFYTWQN